MTTPPPASANPEESLWFFADASNQPQGPVTFAELQRLAKEGVIGSGTPIILQGGTDWTTYSSLYDEGDAANAPLVMPPLREVPAPIEPEPRFAIPSMAGIKEQLLTWWNEHPIWIGVMIFALVFKIAIHLPGSNSQHHSTSPTAAVSKESKEEEDLFAPPASYEHSLITGGITVALGFDVQPNGRSFKVIGKAKGTGNNNLPDGTRILVALNTDIDGISVKSAETAIVKDGSFEFAPICSFDNSAQLTSGTYQLKLTLDPTQQLTQIQAKFGERGANLTGPQVHIIGPEGKGVVHVKFEGSFDFQVAEGDQKREQISKEITARRNELGSLYRELQQFRSDPDFWQNGFLGGRREQWLQRLRSLGESDKSEGGIYGGMLSLLLKSLADDYQKSKGTETQLTQEYSLKQFLADYRRIDPQYGWLGITSRGVVNFMRKLNTGAVKLSPSMVYFVYRGANDAFEVANTSEQYVFYRTTEDVRENSGEEFQIAVERIPGRLYTTGASLKDKLLQVVGVGQFSTVGGGGVDLVIFRPLPE